MVRSESRVKAPLETRDPGPHPPGSSPGTGQEGLHQPGRQRQTKPRGPSPPTGLSRVSAPRQARPGGLGSWGPPTWSPAAVPGLSGRRPARAGTSQTRSGLPLEAPSVKGEREFPLKFNSSEKLLTKTARRPPSPGTRSLLPQHSQRDGHPWGAQPEGAARAAELADTRLVPERVVGSPPAGQGCLSRSPSEVHLRPQSPRPPRTLQAGELRSQQGGLTLSCLSEFIQQETP